MMHVPVSLLLALPVLAALAAAYFLWQNNSLTVTSIRYRNPSIPAAFHGYRIVQVSDLHNKRFGRENRRLFRQIRKAAPDIIAITGDLINSYRVDLESAMDFIRGAVQIAPVYFVTGNHEGRIDVYPELRRQLQAAGVHILENQAVRLVRPGRIAMPGGRNPRIPKPGDTGARAAATDSGAPPSFNANSDPGVREPRATAPEDAATAPRIPEPSIELIGLSDLSCMQLSAYSVSGSAEHGKTAARPVSKDRLNILAKVGPGDSSKSKKAVKLASILGELAPESDTDVPPSEAIDQAPFRILLSHRPDLFDLYAKSSVSLVLAGHAHGGQFRLPFIGGVFAPNQGFFPKFTSGICEQNGTSMIVSRGLGNSSLPIRIFNRPELVVVTLNARNFQ